MGEPTGLPPPVGVLVEVSGEKTTLYSIDSDSDLALAMTTFAQSGTEIITDSQVGNAQFTTATGPISTATHPTTTCICTTSTTESGASALSSTILGTTTPNGDCDCSGIATTTNSPQTTTTIPTTQPTRCTCTTTNPTTATTKSGVSSTTVLTSTTTTGWTTSDGGCDCGDGNNHGYHY